MKKTKESWVIVENTDSFIVRARKCLNDKVLKIQVWSTNSSYGTQGITTIDITRDNLNTILKRLS